MTQILTSHPFSLSSYTENLADLKALIGEDANDLSDFLLTAKAELTEVKEDLVLILSARSIDLVRGVHHSIKPTLSLLNFEDLNNHFEQYKVSLKSLDEPTTGILAERLLQSLEEKIRVINYMLASL